MNKIYSKAYTEVLEIIKYLPMEEYNKIPKSKIDFYEKNKNDKYIFKFDTSKPISEQTLRETDAIIVTIFRDFFANNTQKEKLQKILNNNEKKYQEELRKKYNPDNLFKKQDQLKSTESNVMVEYKESIFKRFINKIKSIFIKNE